MKDIKIKAKQEKMINKATTKRISFGNTIKEKTIQKIVNHLISITDEKLSSDEVVLDNTLKDVVKDVIELGRYDIEFTTQALLDVASMVNTETAKSIKVEVTDLSEEFIDGVLNREIQGLTYSDRIWKNKLKLAEELQTELKKYVIDKSVSLDALKKSVARRYEVDEYVASRLVKHEANTVESLVKHKTYMESDVIQELEFITMNDEFVTEEICKPLHGNIYHKDDPNLPIPPLHIGCRSILRPHYKNMDKYKFS